MCQVAAEKPAAAKKTRNRTAFAPMSIAMKFSPLTT